MSYALYNKSLEVYLNHPKIGRWSTPYLKEAAEMLAACLEYIRSLDISDYEKEFVIIDLETGDECPYPQPALV